MHNNNNNNDKTHTHTRTLSDDDDKHFKARKVSNHDYISEMLAAISGTVIRYNRPKKLT